MIKQEFISKLEERLLLLPQMEKEHVLNFYNETIEDRIEDGMSEEEAIISLGPIEDIVEQVLSEREVQNSVEPLIEKKSHRVVKITILVISSPLWASLLAAAILLNLSLWMLLASLALAIACLVLFLVMGLFNSIHILQANAAAGVVLIGTLLFVVGLIPLSWFALKRCSLWLSQQTKNWWKLLVNLFLKVVC